MLPNIDYANGVAGGGAPVKRPETEKPTQETYAEKIALKSQAKKSETGIRQVKDQVEINFSLTREEREAFTTAFSSKQDPAKMSEEENTTLKAASERISKFIDEAISRNSDNRERIEKVMGEWYSRMTQGKQGPVDLVNLLRQAAMGNLDDLG